MIAAIRVRFTPTPASQMWNDAVFGNWLNMTVQNSLAHYWFRSSLTLADLKFQIFPPIVMDDPRLNMKPEEIGDGAKTREYLVNGVTAKLTDEFHPDWSTFNGMLIWFAQQTDLFGGGGYPVPLPLEEGFFDFLFGGPEQEYKNLPVAVSDIDSPFDAVCQELGHAYGFEHPLDHAREEYGDPYDSMAAAWYGGVYSSAFNRPVDPALPPGTVVDGIDQQRIIGPHISAAHHAIGPFAATLKAAGMFIDVPPSYATGASSFTLHALDDAIGNFPGKKLPMVAVIPPDTPGGETYFLELRRASGYDAGLRKNAPDTSRPPIGVVIHSHDKTRNLIVYHDTLPLADNRGDRDYHMFGGGGFTFRVTSIGADYRSVGITIGGRDFWRHFGVNIEEVRHEVPATTQTEWRKADVSPCFMFPVGEYSYHYKYNLNRYTIVVSSFGYEKPGYVWTVNGTVLGPSASSGAGVGGVATSVTPTSANIVKISASVESPGPTGKTVATKLVPIEYDIGPDRLTLSCDPQIGNFSLVIEVKSVETSPEVMKNFYEDRSVVTSVNFDNVALEWDDNYKQRQKECEDAVEGVNRKHIPQRKFGVPKPDDPFGVRNFEAVINELGEVSLGLANAVVDEVAKVANTIKGQISKRR
jgi:hypothetical protein